MSKAFFIQRYPLLRIQYEEKDYFALNDLSLTRGEHPGVIEVALGGDAELTAAKEALRWMISVLEAQTE